MGVQRRSAGTVWTAMNYNCIQESEEPFSLGFFFLFRKLSEASFVENELEWFMKKS
jgi:hypothetical protein